MSPFPSIGKFLSENGENLCNYVAIMQFMGAAFILILNLFGHFPYGKLSPQSKKEGKFKLSAKFTWRYGFLPTITIPILLLVVTPCQNVWNLACFTAAFLHTLHYFNRSIIYTSQISEKAEPCDASLFLTFVLITTVHTVGQIHYILNVAAPMGWSHMQSLGLLLSLAGMWINSHHDSLLTSLKAEGKGYQIPRGGLFTFVSCANYLGEILEWWGWAMIGGFPMTQTAFATFSSVFLITRGLKTHEWYKEKFRGKYPSERKAVLPFIL